jgi:tripartite-type tricarboxylate transporter receptor subunit TctC
MRTISAELSDALGLSVVVDARPGGNGALAAWQLQASPRDGYTWMAKTLGTTVAQVLSPNQFPPFADRTALALIAYDISVVVVPSSLAAATLPQLLALARRAPGALNYLRTGPGSLSHLVVGLMRQASGTEIEAVDYQGLPPGIVDLVNGHLQLAVLNVGLAMPHLVDGRLRALATVGPRRAPELPDLPTLAELGIGDANITSWAAATTHADAPAAVVGRVAHAFAQALSKEDISARLRRAGLIPAEPMGQAAVEGFLKSEQLRYERISAALNIRAG